jgi:anti-anti-sigma factor
VEPKLPGLDVELHRTPAAAIVMVRGDLDMATTHTLVDAADQAMTPGTEEMLTIDLAEVGFCDSAGVNALVKIRKLSEQRGWQLRVANPHDAVRRVLELTGLATYLNVS